MPDRTYRKTSPKTRGYPGQSKTGVAYNLVGSVEYQAALQRFVGGLPRIDDACDYRQWWAGVYVPYALHSAAIHQSSKSAAGMLRKEVHHG